MFVNPELHYLPHAIVTSLLGGLGWLSKYFVGKAKQEWTEMKTTVGTIESTTREQAGNHLHTIEENTAKTNELLEKLVEGQAEMSGFLRGASISGRRK